MTKAVRAFLSAVAVIASVASVAAPPVENKITIDVMEGDVVNIIRLIGDVSGKNVVVGEEIKGKVTLKLRDVGWRAALAITCKSVGAGVVEEGNILWVTTQARIDAQIQAELDRGAEAELKGPLYTRVLQVNNARAKDLVPIVKAMLTPRGTVTFDERTNVLIIRDVRTSTALRQGF